MTKRATVSMVLVACSLAAAGCGDASGGASRRPNRLVVLGDSIAACSNLGGKDDPACSAKMLAGYLQMKFAPDLRYDNQAMGGAVTTDVPASQLATVAGGPGHVLVLVYVGGNDLARQLLSPDATATSALQAETPAITAAWDQTFAYFEDRSRFPDGATMIMSTQYDPFDDCTAAPYFLSTTKIELLHTFNGTLQDIASRKGAELTDQFTPFLGHGHHYNVATCPHYQAGAEPWMGDLIHPNPAGHADLFAQWQKIVDRLYQ